MLLTLALLTAAADGWDPAGHMLVGEIDLETLYENAYALRYLPRTARLVRIKGAGHAFEQPGAIGAVGEHAVAWLDRLR